MTPDWPVFLRSLYVDNRAGPYWEDVYNCHDEEDRGYFDMLEEMRRKNRSFLPVKKW